MIVYECDICGFYHPWDWDGDCREDSARLTDFDLADDPSIDFVVIRTMEERIHADQVSATSL